MQKASFSRGISSAAVVVWDPLFVFKAMGPMGRALPRMALIREDFPTPDCPEKTEVLFSRRAFNWSRFSPVETLNEIMGILKKDNNNYKKTNKKVSFSDKDEIFIIPSSIDLFKDKEINKVRVGRTKVSKINNIKKSRFRVEIITI